jgi:pimeloyl-ACP methyl ester carboxylesterase
MTRTTNPHLKSATLPGGLRLPYVEQGDPAGVPVILLHGYSDSWRSYELLLRRLPDSIHAFAVTQRGHGDADRPADGYRPEDHAADVAAFMDAVGVEAAVIVGHSGGSYTAQRFALDHPERTLGIVLVGAFHSMRGNPDVIGLREVVSQLTDPVDREFVREFQESCVAQPVPDGFIDAIVAESCKLPARVWKAYLQGIVDAEVPTESGTITAPTLIIWGDRDAFCPRGDQDALAAAIPGARLVTFEGTGHCPHWEQVERTAAELVAFTRRVEPDAQAAMTAVG